MRPMNATLVAMVGAAGIMALATGPALAQTYVYPARGQNPQQQQADMGACHVWATQQTGVNPSAMAPPSTAPQGQMIQGAARGAAVGAVGGAIGGDAGKGAAIGAATGALATAAYNRAYGACLEGRGYTVR